MSDYLIQIAISILVNLGTDIAREQIRLGGTGSGSTCITSTTSKSKGGYISVPGNGIFKMTGNAQTNLS